MVPRAKTVEARMFAFVQLAIQEHHAQYVRILKVFYKNKIKLTDDVTTKKDNPCYNNPCLNGATCQTSGANYICVCPQFYSGTNCQTCK